MRRRLLGSFERSIYKRPTFDFDDCLRYSKYRLTRRFIALVTRAAIYWPKIANKLIQLYADSMKFDELTQCGTVAMDANNFSVVSTILHLHVGSVYAWKLLWEAFSQHAVKMHMLLALGFLVDKDTFARNKITIDVDHNPLNVINIIKLLKRRYVAPYDSILSVAKPRIIRLNWRIPLERVPDMEISYDGTTLIRSVKVFMFRKPITLLINTNTTLKVFRHAVALHEECSVRCIDIFHEGTRMNASDEPLAYLLPESIHVEHTTDHPSLCGCDSGTRDELRKKFPADTDIEQLIALNAEELRCKLRISQALH